MINRGGAPYWLLEDDKGDGFLINSNCSLPTILNPAGSQASQTQREGATVPRAWGGGDWF